MLSATRRSYLHLDVRSFIPSSPQFRDTSLLHNTGYLQVLVAVASESHISVLANLSLRALSPFYSGTSSAVMVQSNPVGVSREKLLLITFSSQQAAHGNSRVTTHYLAYTSRKRSEYEGDPTCVPL